MVRLFIFFTCLFKILPCYYHDIKTYYIKILSILKKHTVLRFIKQFDSVSFLDVYFTLGNLLYSDHSSGDINHLQQQ